MHTTIFLTLYFVLLASCEQIIPHNEPLLPHDSHDSLPGPHILRRTPTTLSPAEITSISAAESRLKSAYISLPGMTSFASGWLSLENQFFSTQTIIPGVAPTATNWNDVKSVQALPSSKILQFGTEYKKVVEEYVATQTFVTGEPKKTLESDVGAYLETPQTGGEGRVGVRMGMVVAGVLVGAVIVML
ncbi:Protein of unknown function [Pyronema omphalodes CBS 100304]|uniref:Uncharacterized protein n=1 Tax=Pyronema omphalodes (strain CBS 100304) TaxID=1076935 RepID=U4KZJ7_PYROM|nr:Protein of unknown function [Pyronema omphalodes CBS 100304]